jgi:pyruvate formate lyase activating enzyme
VWFEITNLMIPGLNDSEEETGALSRWVCERLGPDVPVHFTAFHPDWKMLDRPRTPAATLRRAREIAMRNGVRYAYTGNVHDTEGGTTVCHHCGAPLVVRDWYTMRGWHLTRDGRCERCGTAWAGILDGPVGDWGAKRLPVRLADGRS